MVEWLVRLPDWREGMTCQTEGFRISLTWLKRLGFCVGESKHSPVEECSRTAPALCAYILQQFFADATQQADGLRRRPENIPRQRDSSPACMSAC